MLRVERLRSIGEVAGGVAHDMNNLLATILAQTQVLLHGLEDPALAGPLRAIERAARDGRESVKRIQKFGVRLSEDNYMLVPLDELVAEAARMTSYRWKDEAERHGLAIELRMELGLEASARINAGEIREVLVNLILNACDAMPQGGVITLRSRAEEGWGRIEVCDTGEGMDAETLAHAFELFFTTKGAENTGLGLTISRGIVRARGPAGGAQHAGGGDDVHPLAASAAGREPAARQAPSAPEISGRLRVLIVDDNPMVRTALVGAVACLGGEAEQAADGQAAVRLVAERQFDVVLTDLGMPGMSGWQVAEEVKRLAPDTRVALLDRLGRFAGAASLRRGNTVQARGNRHAGRGAGSPRAPPGRVGGGTEPFPEPFPKRLPILGRVGSVRAAGVGPLRRRRRWGGPGRDLLPHFPPPIIPATSFRTRYIARGEDRTGVVLLCHWPCPEGNLHDLLAQRRIIRARGELGKAGCRGASAGSTTR